MDSRALHLWRLGFAGGVGPAVGHEVGHRRVAGSIAMFLGMAHIQTLLGLEKPDARSDGRFVADNVRTFLCAHAADAVPRVRLRR